MDYSIDNENVLWFTSESNMYRLLSPAFSIFNHNGMKDDYIWALAEDRNGHIFFGSLSGTLMEFDGTGFRERKEFRSLFKNKVCFYKGSRKMSNGDIWFSTNTGVLIWDGYNFSVLKGPTLNTQVCYIYEDPDNKTVLIGTDKGLSVIRDNTDEMLTEFNDNDLGVIEGVAKDDSGVYWLSGHKGLVKYDGQRPFTVREEILPEEFTYTIENDCHGGLWVTSETGLYFRRNSASGFIHGLPESVNVPANSIIRMDSNHILVGRLNDICLIDLKKFYSTGKDYFKLYNYSDGFMGSDCLDNGIIKDRNGRFWILASDNIIIFDPDKLKKDPKPPKMNITGIHYRNR